MIKTVKGNTIVINYDMQLPRPYDNRWMIQGTNGLYSETRNSVYVHGRSPKYHEWESFDPYQEKFDHPWWKQLKQEAAAASHGGTDFLELREFLRAVRNRTQTPIDVYDSVAMSIITAALRGVDRQRQRADSLPGLHPRQVEDAQACVCGCVTGTHARATREALQQYDESVGQPEIFVAPI